jgi:hypothetical protein
VRFIQRALTITRPWGGKVAMLPRRDFDSTPARVHLFRDHPAFAATVVLLGRVTWFEPRVASRPRITRGGYGTGNAVERRRRFTPSSHTIAAMRGTNPQRPRPSDAGNRTPRGEPDMAIEVKRGCGYRKVDGLYMIGGKLNAPCCKLPIPLHICPTCNTGVKRTRGWTWIDPQPWLIGDCTLTDKFSCPAASAAAFGERVGLLWIGEAFYKTPSVFALEATKLGISRRITAIPRNFKLGETWVWLAHPKTVPIEGKMCPGVFSFFKPTAIEKLVTETQSHDANAMKALHDKGITPVIVPDDDKDHQGTVYNDDDDAGLFAGNDTSAEVRPE